MAIQHVPANFKPRILRVRGVLVVQHQTGSNVCRGVVAAQNHGLVALVVARQLNLFVWWRCRAHPSAALVKVARVAAKGFAERGANVSQECA